MKFDQKKILENKFWVMLVVVAPLCLCAVLVLVTSVSGDINQTRGKVDTALKILENVKTRPIKGTSDLALAASAASFEKSQENAVWQKNWEPQSNCFFWPKAIEDKFDFQNGMFAVKIQFIEGDSAADGENRIVGEVTQQKGYYIVVRSTDKDKKTLDHKIFRAQKIEIDDKLPFGKILTGQKVAVTFNRGKYFNELLTDHELNLYEQLNVDFNQDTYLSQIMPILEQVEPMNDKGEGVVQLPNDAGWWFDRRGPLPPSYQLNMQSFLNFIDKGWEDAAGDISEEAWLAQEDLWVQNEIYRLVRLSNDYVGKFELVKASEKDKTFTFKNPYWELTLKWKSPDEVVPTLKNLLGRRQKLGVNFRITFEDAKETVIFPPADAPPLSGPPMAKDDVQTFAAVKLLYKGKFSVEQVLTWQTAAVKRIDKISVGSQGYDNISQSHRTYAEGLDPIKPLNLGVPAIEPPPAPGGGGAGGVRPGMKPGGKPPRSPRKSDNILSRHGLIVNRYYNHLDVNLQPGQMQPPSQFRRIPVAIGLIVDQDHIDRVLTAFGNSKLRFLATQVCLNRYAESLRPQLPKDSQRVVPRNRGAAPPANTTADNMETNYELVLYGMMTLYERYPPPVPVVP